MAKPDPTGMRMLETHRANLAGSKTFEEYRDHHVAYVDCLIEREKARLDEKLAEIKFISRTDVLGEWHGEMFNLCQELRRAGDVNGAAAASYLHDRFCLVRWKIDGNAPAFDETNMAPHPLKKDEG